MTPLPPPPSQLANRRSGRGRCASGAPPGILATIGERTGCRVAIGFAPSPSHRRPGPGRRSPERPVDRDRPGPLLLSGPAPLLRRGRIGRRSGGENGAGAPESGSRVPLLGMSCVEEMGSFRFGGTGDRPCPHREGHDRPGVPRGRSGRGRCASGVMGGTIVVLGRSTRVLIRGDLASFRPVVGRSRLVDSIGISGAVTGRVVAAITG